MMMKNWIIGTLMSVILFGATDVVAQEQALVEQEGKAFLDRDETLTCSCGETGIVSHETKTETRRNPDGSLKKVIIKYIYRCTNLDGHNGRGQAWYTDDKHPKWVRKYVEVDDSTTLRHICSEANRCLVEMDPKNINDVEVERTLIRQCESTDTLIVQMDLGSEKRTYQMVGKTLSFRTTYRGQINGKYFAPAQHRSAKKPTTQGANGKQKPGVRLKR